MHLKSVESHWDTFETTLDFEPVKVAGVYTPGDSGVGLNHGFEVKYVFSFNTLDYRTTSEQEDEALEREYLEGL